MRRNETHFLCHFAIQRCPFNFHYKWLWMQFEYKKKAFEKLLFFISLTQSFALYPFIKYSNIQFYISTFFFGWVFPRSCNKNSKWNMFTVYISFRKEKKITESLPHCIWIFILSDFFLLFVVFVGFKIYVNKME